MRFIEERFDQFIDQRKRLSRSEAYDLYYEFRGRSVEMLSSIIGKIRSDMGRTDDDSPSDMRETLPYRTEYDQMNAGQKSDKKPSWVPLIALIIIVIGIIIAAAAGGIISAMIVFFAGFAFLAIYASVRNSGMSYNFYDGYSATGSRKTGILMALIALAAIVPLFFAGKYGMNGALLLMMCSVFAAVGIYMIGGFIGYLFLPKTKYTEKVTANAIAYVRTMDNSSSGTRGAGRRIRFRTSPLFEYTYQGRTYLAMYDRPDAGTNAHTDLGPATISIDPRNPEDIYNRSARIGLSGIFAALVCFLLAALVLFVFLM